MKLKKSRLKWFDVKERWVLCEKECCEDWVAKKKKERISQGTRKRGDEKRQYIVDNIEDEKAEKKTIFSSSNIIK